MAREPESESAEASTTVCRTILFMAISYFAVPPDAAEPRTIRSVPFGGTNVKAVSLKDGARFQVMVEVYCGRASSVSVVRIILRGSG